MGWRTDDSTDGGWDHGERARPLSLAVCVIASENPTAGCRQKIVEAETAVLLSQL
jgi:hypothetical protein